MASVCGGFSCEAQAVGLGLSHCAPGLCCPMACESIPDQDQTNVPALQSRLLTIGPPGKPDTDTLDVCFAHLYHEHGYMSLHVTA